MSEFRVLGTVEAGRPGRDIDLGHAKQRAILAILLSEVNRPVTAEQLEFRAWGDDAPRGVRSTLYSYLSRLRAALDGLGEIARRQGGYALLVEPDLIDLFRFRALVSRAKTQPDAAAAASLDEAVALWRGPAYDGLAVPWLESRRVALEAERFAAVLERNDLRLRVGELDGLLAPLATEVRLYPLHERLAAQYMMALYRHGQQTAALEHFRGLREELAGRLGSEPGAGLQRLHRRMLRSDPELDSPLSAPVATAPPPPTAARPIPRQLPPLPASFSGREPELATMDDVAAAPAAVLAISGAGGVGKSWLGLSWAHRNRERFVDGQLYVNLRGFEPAAPPLPVGTALHTMLVGLGAEPSAIPADLDSQVGLYRSLVAGKRILVVLDNARDASHVAPLLPGDPGCVTIVTSRRDLSALVTSHGARRIALDIVDDAGARRILERRLTAPRLDAEPEATAELIAGCEGLPLALGIVAARAAGRPDFPLSVVADDLRDAEARLDTLDFGELAASLRAVFAGSVSTLSDDATAVFALLGVAPVPELALVAVASLAGFPPARARRALRELEAVHLVARPEPGRYRMHDLTRLYAAERARSDMDELARDAALRRLDDHYLHTAMSGCRHFAATVQDMRFDAPAAGCLIEPLDGTAAALDWFGAEHANLMAVQRDAEARGADSLVWHLAWVLAPFHLANGRDEEEIEVWKRAEAAGERLGKPGVRSMACLHIGQTLAHMGQPEAGAAEVERSLEFARHSTHPLDMVGAHYAMSMVCEYRGASREALAHSKRALELARDLDDPKLLARVLNGTGWDHALCGEYRQARRLCSEALTVVNRLGDNDVSAGILDSLGYIAFRDGDYASARDHYEAAVSVFARLKVQEDEPRAMACLATVLDRLGETDRARHTRHRALELFRAQGIDDPAEQLLNQLGDLAAPAGLVGAVLMVLAVVVIGHDVAVVAVVVASVGIVVVPGVVVVQIVDVVGITVIGVVVEVVQVIHRWVLRGYGTFDKTVYTSRPPMAWLSTHRAVPEGRTCHTRPWVTRPCGASNFLVFIQCQSERIYGDI